MKLNSIQIPANIPADFGAPIYGHASAPATLAGVCAFGATTTVVRERQDALKGDMGLVAASVPGTSAWRPPPS